MTPRIDAMTRIKSSTTVLLLYYCMNTINSIIMVALTANKRTDDLECPF